MITYIKTNNKNEERTRPEMRKKQDNQMPLMITSRDHPRAKELEAISKFLDRNPFISDMVWQDLTRDIENTLKGEPTA